MNTRMILSLSVIALGSIAAILPQKQNDSMRLTEKELMQQMLRASNYISPDELAERLIAGDPSLRLIDVRSVEDFSEPIPRALHIPIDSLFSENYLHYFTQTTGQNIFYSGDDQKATQVWMITRQMGNSNNYLLRGGLAAWEADILHPTRPAPTAAKDEHQLYEMRLAMKAFFTGEQTLPDVKFIPIAPVQGRKKKRVQGGCS